MIRKKQNVVEGRIVIRGIMTYTLDKKRSSEQQAIMRVCTKEKLLTPKQLQARVDNPDSQIHRAGVCLLYAFHGKVNGKPISFDTERNALIKTLGYSIASVHDGVLYATFKLLSDLESDPPFIQKYDVNDDDSILPDLLGAIRASKLEIGSEIKFRAFRGKDTKLFDMPYMRNIYPEPSTFAKSGHLYMPENNEIRIKKGAKRKKGRPANPDKIPALNTEPIQDMITEWDIAKSKNLSGFKILDRKARVTVFEKIDDDGASRVKITMNQFKVNISYLSVDDNDATYWEPYKEWVADLESDSQVIKREIKEELIKILAAF